MRDFTYDWMEGIGENFNSLTESVQQKILELVEKDTKLMQQIIGSVEVESWGAGGKLAGNLGIGIGNRYVIFGNPNDFHLLKESMQKKFPDDYTLKNSDTIQLKYREGNTINIRGSYDKDSFSLKESVQQKILELVEKDADFAKGLGHSVGIRLHALNEPLQLKILQIAEKSISFMYGLKRGLMPCTYHLISQSAQLKILEFPLDDLDDKKNISRSFLLLSQPVKSKILELFKSDEDFAKLLKEELRRRITYI